MSYTTHAAGARNGHGNNAADQFQPQGATHGMMSADYSVVLQGMHAKIKGEQHQTICVHSSWELTLHVVLHCETC